MIYKKDAIDLDSKYLMSYKYYELDGTTPRTSIYNNIYKTFKRLPAVAYYLNSISFNEFCDFKSTYNL